MDRPQTSSATMDEAEDMEPWTRHGLDEPFQLAPELTKALRRPKRQLRRVDAPKSQSRVLAALREFVDWKAITLIVLFLTWLALGFVLFVLFTISTLFACSLAPATLSNGPAILVVSAVLGLGGSSLLLLRYFKEAVSNRLTPSIPNFGTQVTCIAAAALSAFSLVTMLGLMVSFMFDDQLDHIRDWSPSDLTWRDRSKLRTVTRGVSIPSNATHIWANSMEFLCPDPWSCVTFQCDRETAVKFVEAVAERPLDHFKTSYNEAIQVSRFDEISYDGKHLTPWRGRQVTDVRFVEFPESWGGVALDLSTNTVYVIRD